MAGGLLADVESRQRYVPPPRDGDDVSGKVARSSVWSGLGVAATTLLQLVRSMIFAHLLVPGDFGVVNLATVFTQFVLIFANFGFTASVIFHDDLDQRDLATSWWGNLFVDTAAAVICVVVALISQLVSSNPMQVPIIALLAVQFVVASVGSVNMALMRRQFMYKELAIVEFIGALSFLVGWVFIKIFHWGVYGLVASSVVGTAMMTVLYFLYLPWLPSWQFSWTSLRKHFQYGRWLLGVNVVTYVNTNADRAVVGGMLDTTQLGYYEYASNIPLQITTKISYVFNSVLFSAFSSLQNDPAGIKELLRKLYRYNALLIFPILTGIALVAPKFVLVAYGEVWMPIIPTIRLFCLYGALMLYIQVFHAVCMGVGEQQMPFRWTAIFLPINLALIYVGVKVGQLDGVVLMRSAAPIFMALTLGVQIMRRVHVSWSLLLKATLPAAAACVVMAAAVLLVDRLSAAAGLPDLVHLLVSIAVGALAYGALLFVCWRDDLMNLVNLARRFS